MRLRSRKCIDKIEKNLSELGLRSTRRINPHKLKVRIDAKQGVRYTVYFISRGERVSIEAVAFKSLSGEHKWIKMFYEALMTFSASLHPFSFGMVSDIAGGQKIILQYSPICETLSPEEMVDLIQCLNEVYSIHIPRFYDLAKEYNLEFTGHDEFNIGAITRILIGE